MFSLEKAQGGLTNVCKHLKGGYMEDGARLFSMVPSDRSVPRGNAQTQTQKVLSEQQETLAEVPRGIENSPSLEILKSYLDILLDNWV